MSSLTSAMITRAAVVPTPGISSSRATAEAKGAISFPIEASSSAMSASRVSIRGEHLAQQQPVVVGEMPGERLLQLADLGAQPTPG
jgi:hypothetical protein